MMSFFKKLFGSKQATSQKQEPQNNVAKETPLPDKDLLKVFPYVKYRGGSPVAIGYTFKISDSIPEIIQGKFRDNENKEHSLALIQRNILPDCGMYYGFDEGQFFEGIMPSHFNENLRLNNIDEIAKENLEYFINNTNPLQISSSDSGINLFACGGDYESSVIIFENLWLNIQEELGSFLYVSVAARDMCLFVKGNDLVAIDLLKGFVQEHYSTYHKPLSKYMYKVVGTNWTVVEKIID
jgi:hypothetical protein